ncbi:MAG: ATP-binding protein [Tateyamaria sp.]|jgi:two-component system osmolarity sensor histidine kinase EnvZ|nr:ATP-binding protein [Tateyamaria sp.]MDG2058496.1 ATP-binding protein [Tateyamaria sp.]
MKFLWLKHYFPRGIYARAALILLLPVVVVQIVVLVVFVQRHFEDVTQQMSDTVIRELQLVLAADPEQIKEIAGPLEMLVVQREATALTDPDSRLWYDFSGLVIIDRLSAALPQIAVFDLYDDDVVQLVVDDPRGPLDITFDRRRISASNPHQLLVNMLFFSVLITAIAFIYLRNQLRPIKRLADAAEAFGRGRHLPYTPAGATEVRSAGTAFVDMRNRIERQIETRTLMLSGVSHDLRTPLTRMRLALSMLEDQDCLLLEQDVTEMQRMIDAFLSFAAGDNEGAPEQVKPEALARELVKDAQRAGQPVTFHKIEGTGTVILRPLAMRRALDNLISNAVRYGAKAEVSVAVTNKSVRFRVEDDGPGIPEAQRADAQRPFVRLDRARNQDKGSGVGLGLAIATDIARAHGGVLRLGHCDRLGGLRADIVIAR